MNKSLKIPTVQFSLVRANKLYLQCVESERQFKEANEDTISSKQLKKCFKPFVDYVKQYYYLNTTADYYYYNVDLNDFEQKPQSQFKKEVITKINTDIYKKLFEKDLIQYTMVSSITAPRIYKIEAQDETNDDRYFINSFKGFLHKNYKPYEEYSPEIKKKVNIMLDMIKEISCGNDEQFYQAYIKYLSQLCRGQKTECIIYKKSEQGTGKSTESDFLMNYVLGRDICLISSGDCLTTGFNIELLGKLLVIFEELPVFSTQQWNGVSSKLKQLATGKESQGYTAKGKDTIQAENISNFIINTNCESIKDSHGRRIIIMPINNSRIADHTYFESIRANCFNLEVGEAFYSYMLSVDIMVLDSKDNKTKPFYGQSDTVGFPETDAKRIAIANLLHPVYKFLKYEFLLKSKAVDKVKAKDLYNYYEVFCVDKKLNAHGKNDFMKKLEEIGIIQTKINGYWYYNIKLETLEELARKWKWLCKYDLLNEPEDDTFIDDDDDDTKYIASLKNKICALENELNELKNKSLSI